MTFPIRKPLHRILKMSVHNNGEGMKVNKGTKNCICSCQGLEKECDAILCWIIDATTCICLAWQNSVKLRRRERLALCNGNIMALPKLISTHTVYILDVFSFITITEHEYSQANIYSALAELHKWIVAWEKDNRLLGDSRATQAPHIHLYTNNITGQLCA